MKDSDKASGVVSFAQSDDRRAAYKVRSSPKPEKISIKELALRFTENQSKLLNDYRVVTLNESTINGLKSVTYEASGQIKSASGKNWTYMTAIIEGSTEIAVFEGWAETANIEQYRSTFAALPATIGGLTPVASPSTPLAVQPPPPLQPDAPDFVAEKLRRLQQMLKEGLITPDDFEAKKREILKDL